MDEREVGDDRVSFASSVKEGKAGKQETKE